MPAWRAGARGDRPPRRARGLTDRGRAVLGAGVLLAACGLVLGFPDLTRLGGACLALPLFARWIGWRRRPRLHVDRALEPAPLVAGRPGRIRVCVRNVGPRGCDPLAAAEHVSPWLGSTARLVLPPLRPGEETTGAYDVRPARRGRHLAGPLRVVGRDPLGLTHLRAAVGEPLEVLVLPPVHDLSGGDPVGLGMGHEGEAPAAVLAGTEHDVSVREYRQGDDLRRVHWGVTAHRGRLMVRHEALPRLRRAVLVLDASARSWGLSADARPGPSALADGREAAAAGFEWAIEAMASIAAHLSGLGFTLHLVLSGAAPTPSGRLDDPARPLLVDDVLTQLALVTPGVTAPPPAPPKDDAQREGETERAPLGPAAALAGTGSLSAAAREVAGAGGLVVLVTGDWAGGSAHDTFGVLRTGLSGLAVVVDTAAFARQADRDWWIPQGSRAAAATGAESSPAGGAGVAGGPGAAAGAEARRLCGYARSGGWRAVAAVPTMTPALAWSELLGTPRAWADGPKQPGSRPAPRPAGAPGRGAKP